MTIDELMKENKEVLERLKNCDEEYYTAEQMAKSLNLDLTKLKQNDII